MTTTIIDSHLIGIETDQQTIALVVTMEDAPLHTDEHPFCSDMTCPCHEKFDFSTGFYCDYYFECVWVPYLLGLLTTQEALRIYYNTHM